MLHLSRRAVAVGSSTSRQGVLETSLLRPKSNVAQASSLCRDQSTNHAQLNPRLTLLAQTANETVKPGKAGRLTY